MKKTIIVIIATVMAVSMFARCSGSAATKSEKDSVAYCVGLDLGRMIKGYDSTLNVKVIAQAIQDVMDNKEKFTPEAADEFMRDYHMVRLPARAKKAEEEFFAKVEKDNKNIQKTESGILYEIIDAGSTDDKIESDNDVVKVQYEGKLKDGKVFDSSYERGEAADLRLSHLIKGWKEGMRLVGKGGKIKLYIPAELGYGSQGQGQIGPNEPLVFDIELVDIIHEEDKE